MERQGEMGEKLGISHAGRGARGKKFKEPVMGEVSQQLAGTSAHIGAGAGEDGGGGTCSPQYFILFHSSPQ